MSDIIYGRFYGKAQIVETLKAVEERLEKVIKKRRELKKKYDLLDIWKGTNKKITSRAEKLMKSRTKLVKIKNRLQNEITSSALDLWKMESSA